jgi:hypothetical protein
LKYQRIKLTLLVEEQFANALREMMTHFADDTQAIGCPIWHKEITWENIDEISEDKTDRSSYHQELMERHGRNNREA